jgi:hypothetical protein
MLVIYLQVGSIVPSNLTGLGILANSTVSTRTNYYSKILLGYISDLFLLTSVAGKYRDSAI